jgi:hypothetical protein
MNFVLFVYCRSQMLELCHIFQWFIYPIL